MESNLNIKEIENIIRCSSALDLQILKCNYESLERYTPSRRHRHLLQLIKEKINREDK